MTFVIRPPSYNGPERHLIRLVSLRAGSVFCKAFSSILLYLSIVPSALAGYLSYHNPGAGRTAGFFGASGPTFSQKMTFTSTGCTDRSQGSRGHRSFAVHQSWGRRYRANGAAAPLESSQDRGAMSQICVTTKSIFSVLILSDFLGWFGVNLPIAPDQIDRLAGSVTETSCGSF